MVKKIVLNVQMACGGCSGAVTRLLKKVQGVVDVEASLDAQNVTVTGDDIVTADILMESIKKWADSGGKTISIGSEESL